MARFGLFDPPIARVHSPSPHLLGRQEGSNSTAYEESADVLPSFIRPCEDKILMTHFGSSLFDRSFPQRRERLVTGPKSQARWPN